MMDYYSRERAVRLAIMNENAKYRKQGINSLKIKLIIAVLVALSVVAIIQSRFTAYGSTNNYIIAPKELEGLVGGKINIEEVFVQRVTLTQVENIRNVELVDDSGVPITTFPKEEYKAIVREKDTKEQFGFLTLKPYKMDTGTPTALNQKGEYLFYQNGRVFNSLSSSEEGKIYFWKRGKTVNSRPLILLIGEVENGIYTPGEYVEVTSKTVSLIKEVKK